MDLVFSLAGKVQVVMTPLEHGPGDFFRWLEGTSLLSGENVPNDDTGFSVLIAEVWGNALAHGAFVERDQILLTR